VLTIPNNAFYNCSSLTEVSLGENVSDIQDEAFFLCYNINKVTCQGTTPPIMSNNNCFICYNTATLFVPYEAINLYKSSNGWKNFKNIVCIETSLGDVNLDGEVNIADVNAIIDMILSGSSSSSGDVNGDGEVNIADVNAVIDKILISN